MMKIVRTIEKVLAGVILAIMTIITFLAAINRFTLHLAMPWSEEIVKFLVMWMTMIGAALGIGRNEHVGIDVFIDRLPEVARFAVKQLTTLVGTVFSIIFIYIGYLMVIKQYAQKSTALEISMGIVYACVIAGGILMTIEFAYKFFKGFQDRKTKKLEVKEVEA